MADREKFLSVVCEGIYRGLRRVAPARLKRLLLRTRQAEKAIVALSHKPGAVAKAKRARRQIWRDPQLVVFVSNTPRAREAKVAYGLKSMGWRVVLLHKEQPNFDLFEFFDEIKTYGNEWQALSLAGEYSPLIYHVFSLMADKTAVAFVKHRPGRVIFEGNDITQTLTADLGETPQWQRYCLENADGVSSRDLQLQHVKRKWGYRLPEKLILFAEYCWDAQGGQDSQNARQVERKNGELHVVLCGNFGIERLGGQEWGYLDIAREFSAAGVHFHIYPHWSWYAAPRWRFEEVFCDYLELQRKTGLIHLHPCVRMDQVVNEIRNYDFGINVIRATIYGAGLSNYTSAHHRYCGSGRNMDYLDAGLPVILTKDLAFQYAMLARYGVAIEATPVMLQNARERLQQFLTPEVKQQIRKARTHYSIQCQISRLLRFYQSVANNGGADAG
ncbi:MAG: hypothetical protein HY645_08395 [Acidobacteria bacterium]|nr:hypothetical protein [Acidobacteriota bacterium]